MLHGVGGRTVAEAKQRMSYPEALRWFAYLKKHGSPNQHLHRGFALLAAQINNALGGDAKVTDFMLGEHSPAATQESEQEASLMDVFNLLAGRA
ncbi:MAG: hypothetical protein KDH17_09670 [Rhodocyclaceae bacterium]|nr:hypothetical protein [Rhodocyclaceae bacterium]